MGPEHLKLMAAVLAFLKEFGSWPIVMILLVMIVGPWILAVILAWGQSKRFDAVAEMYKNNVELVKGYESVCKVQGDREQSLRDLIAYSTRVNERLVDRLDGKASLS
jgi:hypothetical protein